MEHLFDNKYSFKRVFLHTLQGPFDIMYVDHFAKLCIGRSQKRACFSASFNTVQNCVIWGKISVLYSMGRVRQRVKRLWILSRSQPLLSRFPVTVKILSAWVQQNNLECNKKQSWMQQNNLEFNIMHMSPKKLQCGSLMPWIPRFLPIA